MADYKQIHGEKIKVLSSNPSTPAEGDIWYNSTDNNLKGTAGGGGGSWSSGGNLGTARYGIAGAGTQTAGLGFGGNSGSVTAATEEYDGSAWTTGGTMATARRGLAGAGTQTAGLGFGGYDTDVTAATEEYMEHLGHQVEI